MGNRWLEPQGRATLEALRMQCDDVINPIMVRLFREGRAAETWQLMASLADNSDLPDAFPPDLFDALDKMDDPLEAADIERIRRAQDFFDDRGLELVLMLLHYGLPTCYACWRGARVLTMTGRLSPKQIENRVIETAQFVIDVMDQHGLDVEDGRGRGVRTAQKVRLMHAAIRHHIDTYDKGWDDAIWGRPINQLDQLGTLLAFTAAPLIGLEKMGRPITAEERALHEDYIYAWNVVGQMLGLSPEILPVSADDAKAQWYAILDIQGGPSDDGRLLLHALLDLIAELIPGTLVDGVSASLMHEFLDPRVIEWLEVPPPDWTIWPMRALNQVARMIDLDVPVLREIDDLNDLLVEQMVEGLLAFKRTNDRDYFRLPQSLTDVVDDKPRTRTVLDTLQALHRLGASIGVVPPPRGSPIQPAWQR